MRASRINTTELTEQQGIGQPARGMPLRKSRARDLLSRTVMKNLLCASALVAGLSFGCAAGAPAVPPQTPAIRAPAAAAPERKPEPEPAAGYLSPLPPADPHNLPPASCQAYLHPTPTAEPTGACAGTHVEVLDRAMAVSDPVARDAALATLEVCQAWEPGFLVALRADLAPVECADGLIEAWFAEAVHQGPDFDMRGDFEQALLGLDLAARLRRIDSAPPALPEPFDKPRFLEYFNGTLQPWVVERARAIQKLSMLGSQLDGYGRGVVAVEAAMADLRFVEMARGIALPQDMQDDPEVKQAYFGALDEALEPRKRRGRDAALAGLDAFAKLGVLRSERVQRAREVLSQSYAGHRIDALDGLQLPPLDPPARDTPRRRLAAALPPFLAAEGLGAIDVSDAPLLRALLEQGFAPPLRAALDAAPLSEETAALYARFWVLLGQRYFRSGDFIRAATLSTQAPESDPSLPPGSPNDRSAVARLIEGLAAALGPGPKDAREMIVGGPLLPGGVGDVRVLDALSKEPGQLGGLAAYDAAYVLALLPPIDEPRRFWNGIAARYDLAAKKLEDRDLAASAKAAAKNARQTAAAIPR